MGLFSPRTFPEIISDMLARLLSSTPLDDVNYGSIWTTMLEAAAQEDDEQYFQMIEVVRGYSLDSVYGEDLDNRAAEYDLERDDAEKASTYVTIGDSAITKVETNVYSGLPGAVAGSNTINGNSATGFSTSGSIIIGRGTSNVETIAYSSITTFTNYVRFNLSSNLANDHGTDETIILSQGGSRVVVAGTVVMVPASDISPEVKYTLDVDATILDGEEEVTEVLVTAQEAGADANVPVGAISEFESLPFATATVRNPSRVTNGINEETDQELRDKIKDTIQSLSRGTVTAIITGIQGLVSESDNKRVISVSLREPTLPADVVKLFIDDGTGFIPTFDHIGEEIVIAAATGGEKFLNVVNIPIVKASVETQNSEPYNILNNSTLFVDVNGITETITFVDADFETPGQATAQEVLRKINSIANLFEARVSSGGEKVRIFARANSEEEIRVVDGTANVALGFPTDTKYTLKLYLIRDNQVYLLSKDGKTAAIESGISASYNMSSRVFLSMIADGKVRNILKCWFDPSDFVVPGTVSAIEIVDIINERVPGILVSASSADSKITISSLTERSQNSKIKILSDFTAVRNEEGGTLINRLTEFKGESVNVNMFAAIDDYVYLGHESVPFDSVAVNLNVNSSHDIEFIVEYWNGTSWVEIGVQDSTNGFTQSGNILFVAPFDWTIGDVDSVSAYWLRIQRKAVTVTTPPQEKSVRICRANELFGFSETEVVGANKDYTLNRFIGQIELENALIADDKLVIGSLDTRAYVVPVSAGNYSGLVGQTLSMEVDGVAKSITFVAGDFGDILSATPAEVVAAINSRIVGVTASTIESGTKFLIRTNTFENGSFKIVSGGANSIFNFPVTLVENLIPNQPYLESDAGPWTFDPSDTLMIIVDDNFSSIFTTPLFKQSTLTGVNSTTQVVDTTLNTVFPNDDDISGYDFYVVDGPQAGDRVAIASYVAASGVVNFSSALGGLPVVGNAYQVIPKDVQDVVSFLNNKQITLLSTKVEVTASSGGTKLQLASYLSSEEASIAVSGGTANTKFNFDDEMRGVDGYRYFTGLAQEVQWTVDGKESDPENYEGIRAGGVQVEVIEPIKIPVSIEIDVTATEGVNLTNITNEIKSAISNYINKLNVGEDVILSEIVVSVKSVTGVYDAVVTSPTANIAIADSELARIADDQITVI